MRKILVLGCKGMAGHVIKSYLEQTQTYDVWGLARGIEPGRNLINLDITGSNQIEDILSNEKFDVVINCIGVLNNSAEDNCEQAIWFNSYFPHLLSSFSRKYNYYLIHLSTDCVFSGKEGSYREKSFKNGIGVYAQSKALGELENSKDLTFRTSIVGPELKANGIGLFHWFMNQQVALNGFTNVFWSGVTTIELAKAINAAISQELTGLYHLTNNAKISKHDLLVYFNRFFKSGELEITPYSDYNSDKSFVNSRTDFNFTVGDYTEMMKEMKVWMLGNSEFYGHYSLDV